jgi:hypothetical protein
VCGANKAERLRHFSANFRKIFAPFVIIFGAAKQMPAFLKTESFFIAIFATQEKTGKR